MLFLPIGQRDGIPGIPRWGAVGQHTLRLSGRCGADGHAARSGRLAQSLRTRRDKAGLYKRLATLRTDVPLKESVAALEWRGARRAELEALCERLGDRALLARVPRYDTG